MHGDVTISIQQREERVRRMFTRISYIWYIVTFGSLISTTYFVLIHKPNYLSDWHGLAILVLALAIIAIYRIVMRGYRVQTARPFLRSLVCWLTIYLLISLLSWIDNGFSYNFYIAFGLAFPLFDMVPLIPIVLLVFVTVCYYEGILSWAPLMVNIGALVGNAIGFFSITVISMMAQYLSKERFERSQLLQVLSQTNTELAEAHKRLAESVVQEQELAVLRERTRFAREMHDTLGHALVLIAVKLEAAQRLRERDPQRCEQELETTKDIVRETMKELRASIANLRSPALEKEPVCRAISRYACEMAKRVGLHVSYDLHSSIEGLPEQIEETLWRVAQEALTNVEKHAHASNVVIHISRQDGAVLMRVEDDGVGLPWERCQGHQDGSMSCASPEGHYGLSGMVERVESLNGRFSLRPNREHGTVVAVELPLVEAPL